MRNLLLHLIFLSLPCIAICQPGDNTPKVPILPLINNKIVYAGSVSLDPSYSKRRLFDNAQQWYRHNFESNDNVLTIINIDSGMVSGPGIIHARRHEKLLNPKDIFFTIDVGMADGRYSYKVYGIHYLEDTSKFYFSDMYNEQLYPTDKPHWPEPYRRSMLINMNEQITAMIEKLQEGMKK
jgi:hypothetical protein